MKRSTRPSLYCKPSMPTPMPAASCRDQVSEPYISPASGSDQLAASVVAPGGTGKLGRTVVFMVMANPFGVVIDSRDAPR